MASTQVKKIRKRIKRVFFLILCTIMIVTTLPRITTIAQLYEQKQELTQQKQALEQEKAELTTTRDSMDNLETIEKSAREKLGMIKEGERLMVEKKE